MNKTATDFRFRSMNAIVCGSACIFDYFQLMSASNTLIQFIAAYIMQIKHWRFTEMITVRFKSDEQKTHCEFSFQDGTVASFDVMQDEHSRFFVKE